MQFLQPTPPPVRRTNSSRAEAIEPVRDDARSPFEVVIEALARGIEAVGPGAKCGDVARRCIEVLERSGYDQHQLHGPGHSCGIMGVFWGREEKGEIRPYNDTPLEPGMVVTVEPAVYLPGVGGFRHCDVLAVTAAGHELLTHYDRDLLEIR